jgi:threonine dehydrogenase-like Zn-dependent dehydrogenase
MPATVSLDLTGLWHREVSIKGVYAYTHEQFQQAFDVVRNNDLGRLVSATYPLDRWKDAIRHAAEAGRRGAVKVAFDLRNEKERNT